MKSRFDKGEGIQHFSLRKLSIGVASVLLGTSFMTFGAKTVHADSQNNDSNQNNDDTSLKTTTADKFNSDAAKNNYITQSELAQKNQSNSKNNSQDKQAALSVKKENKAEVKNAQDKSQKSVEKTALPKADSQESNTTDKAKNAVSDNKENRKNISNSKDNKQNTNDLKKVQDKSLTAKELATNKATASSPTYTEAQIKHAFDLDKPDLTDAQLAALGLDRTTYLQNGVKVKINGEFKAQLVNGQHFDIKFQPTHNADGTYEDYNLDHHYDATIPTMGITHFGFTYITSPILEGGTIYINIGHNLDSADAERGLPKQYESGYADLVWDTKSDAYNVNINKVGTYTGVVDVTYKSHAGVSTRVKVVVVDLKGATITGTLGKDIQNKVEEVDQNPGKYISGQPQGKGIKVTYGPFNRPDISKITTKENPAVGTVQVIYPDGNTGIAKIDFIITNPETQEERSVTETRTVKFGYIKGDTGNLSDWVSLAPDVVQTKTLTYKVKVDPDGTVHFAGWDAKQDATLAAVPWVKVSGWTPRFDVLGPNSDKDNAAIKQALIDLTKDTNISDRSDVIYATYVKQSTHDVDTGEAKSFERRVHFGYYDENHKWQELTQPEVQDLFFHHHILEDQYNNFVKDDGWKPVTTQILPAVSWKTIEGWTKAGKGQNAADSYMVLLDDIAKKPENQLQMDVYAPYTRNSQPTQPTGPVNPTNPTQPTSQPTNVPPKPIVNPTSPSNTSNPTTPKQPTNIPPRPTVNPTSPSNTSNPTTPKQPTNVRPRPTVNPSYPKQPTNPGNNGQRGGSTNHPGTSSNIRPLPESGGNGSYTGTVAPKAEGNGTGNGELPANNAVQAQSALPQTGESTQDEAMAAAGMAIAVGSGIFVMIGADKRHKIN